jgi:hypothetical protein
MFSGLSSKECIQYSTRVLKMSYSVSLRGNVIIAHLKAGWAWGDHDLALSEICSIANKHPHKLAMLVIVDAIIPSGYGEAAQRGRAMLPRNLSHVQFVANDPITRGCLRGIMALCKMPYTWGISKTILSGHKSVANRGYSVPLSIAQIQH